MRTLVVVSDIHYAGPTEQTRRGFEWRSIPNPIHRVIAQTYRSLIWLRDPMAHNGQLDKFLAVAGEPDLVVCNGDYSVDTAFVGLADDGVRETVSHCLNVLRSRFGDRFHSTLGDHELGKKNLFGEVGGLRIESYRRAVEELDMKPFWKVEVGNYVLIGIASTIAALSVYHAEIEEEERARWEQIRKCHLADIRESFARLTSGQRVILFTHDPTSLPFIAQEEEVRARLGQVEQTIIGHLHSEPFLKTGRMLAGIPTIRFLGNTIRRYTTALQSARQWEPFKLLLCPSLTGIQIKKDGGFLTLELDEEARHPLRITRHRLPWD